MNEAVGLTAGMRILPLDRTAVGMVGREHLRCHVPRTTAQIVNVEGVKELNQSPLLERREPQRRRQKTDALASKAARKAKRHVGPQFAHAVERQKHGGTLRGLLVTQTDMKFTRSLRDHQFATVSICPLDRRLSESIAIDRMNGREARRRGLQDQSSR